MQQLTAAELKQRLNNGEQLQLLDVREGWEFALCRLDNSLHIPLSDLLQLQALNLLDSQREIVVICHHGIRSQQAAMLLKRNGFDNVSNLQGGVHHWSLQVNPSMPRY